ERSAVRRGAYTGVLSRPFRPAAALLFAALFDVSNGLRNQRPSGPGALPATLPPVLNVLFTPRWGPDDSRGARKARTSRMMQMTMTAPMIMAWPYPRSAGATRRVQRASAPAALANARTARSVASPPGGTVTRTRAASPSGPPGAT